MLPPACPNCGANTEPEASFCGICGERLVAPQIPMQPPPPMPMQLAGRPGASNLDIHRVDTKVDVRAASLLGRILNGRYVIDAKIGEGGFGAVWRGRQIATGRPVALKLLHPHNTLDTTAVARFRREAEACSKLRSPHTVITYDFDETEDGVLYLAMELLRGRPLQDVQNQEGPLPAPRVLKILAQVAEALGEAHALGIVHRDMKPENIMVESRDGEDLVKVLDFGIAKIAEPTGRPALALTAVGQTLGTLEFMSPEQLRGQPLDGRSDIYALGILAYEMLTGRLPFDESRGPSEIIQFHMQGNPAPPSALRPDLGIGRDVDAVVLKMVAKSRDERHADAGQLRDHIDRALAAMARASNRKATLRVVAMIAGGVAALLATLLLLTGV
jgi:eukaryotic-like serine/threonine-protein kinase